MRKLILDSWAKPNLLSLLFWPLSILYRVLFALKRSLYAMGVLTSYRAPVPVVVVGNITVGGTGKTPLVIYLVEELRKRGFTPGVISRGYGALPPHTPFAVSKDSLAEQVGDEPLLIASRTQVPLVIGPNRQQSIELLLKCSEVDIIISDDGLQHFALQRDVELCLSDTDPKPANTMLLPAGPYREPLSRFKSVDFVIHRNSSNANVSMRLEASEPVSMTGRHASEFNAGEPVHAVAGIGKPERFFQTCSELNLSIIRHPFADHHNFTQNDLDFADSDQVLMTEKDAVKCRGFAQHNYWYLPVSAKLSNGFIDKMLRAIESAQVDQVSKLSS